MTKARPPIPSSMCQAALHYAQRGWPVFPCREHDGEPYQVLRNGKWVTEIPRAKAPYIKNGCSGATTDPNDIKLWWTRWPNAAIGVAMGRNGCFALDFDPRVDEETDPETGEVIARKEWTLEQLKAETEAQIGRPLPVSMAVRTPSGGVHVYYQQPDDGGAEIRNRGVLPLHVDVRGKGGYVIVPPSKLVEPCPKATAGEYRFLRGRWDAEIEPAPDELVHVLRSPKRKAAAKAGPPSGEDAAADQAASASTPSPPRPSAAASDDAVEAHVRRYGLSALEAECRLLAATPLGNRDNQANSSGFVIGQLVGAGALSLSVARAALEGACSGFEDPAGRMKAVENGLRDGQQQPRDLSSIRAEARDRAARYGPQRSRGHAPPAPPPSSAEDQSAPFRDGRQASGQSREGPGGSPEAPAELSEADKVRLQRIAAAWLARRLEKAEELFAFERKKDLLAIAWGVGRRASAGLIDANAAKEAIWPHCEDIADLRHADVDRAIDDGWTRGFDPGPVLLDLRCAGYPMTDFGLAERFLDRFGDEFRFTMAKGWLGWDGRRWKVLDQDKDTLPAQLISAVFDTIRAVQREARRVAETRARLELVQEGKQQRLDLEQPNKHAVDRWILVGKQWKLYSDMLAAWGRQCEQAGKPAAIANLARGTPGIARERWLTVPIGDFDCEQMAVNVLNGTLRFEIETLPDGKRKVAVRRDDHRREDLITRLAPVDYDREAACPLYDGMVAWAQPDDAMRRYLHQVGGYACSGDTGEHKLWFNYGRGRNGKSTTIDSWCSALGDYTGTIGIESFLDQGVKKRGDQATPDLAELGGVRMLRASEPERGAKLNSALIKAATGGEPMSVRALHRGFFPLLPRFKLLMSGNSKPAIPDTDEGIWSRMKLIPWLRNIDQPEAGVDNWPKKDPKLTEKIKAAELAGVFRKLIEGLVDYLEHGFVEPEGVTAATQAYRDQSDPLARFLRLCTEMDKDSRVKSSELHAVFCAWCKAAGEKEWSQKGFSDAMIDKGFAKTRSDGMRWEGLCLTRTVDDFVDSEGRVRSILPDLDAEGGGGGAAAAAVDDPDPWFDDKP